MVTTELIEKITTKVFDLNPEEIKSKTHKPEIALPRQIVITLAYFVFETGTSSEVASYYLKDHSTVWAARKRVISICSTEKDKQDKISYILSLLKLHVSVDDDDVQYNIRLFEKSISLIKKIKYV